MIQMTKLEVTQSQKASIGKKRIRTKKVSWETHSENINWAKNIYTALCMS